MGQIIQFPAGERQHGRRAQASAIIAREVGLSTVVDLSAARQRLAVHRQAQNDRDKPEWFDDILTLAAYAQLVKAEHAAESARIAFEHCRDGIAAAWWEGPEEIKERVHENNRKWDLYIGLALHLAQLPATTRNQARVKRNTIGKQWLAPDVSCTNLLGPLREGCLRDDHLFPPSLKLARR